MGMADEFLATIAERETALMPSWLVGANPSGMNIGRIDSFSIRVMSCRPFTSTGRVQSLVLNDVHPIRIVAPVGAAR